MSDKKVIPIGGGGGGGESVIVDSELNVSSTNPVQNKAITNALNNKANKATTLAGYGIGDAYTKSEVDSIKSEVETSATNKVTTHNASTTAHSDIRNLISELATRLNTLANSDDTTLDQMAEVVAYIKDNRGLIEGVTTAKANKDYVDEELAKKANAATTLSGYGITDAYTKTTADSNFVGWNRGAFNADELYDGGVFMIAQGTNVPSGSKYGSLLVMPYRQLTGNTKTDFGTQIFIPNGDDATNPNSMFFRTSLGASWNAWQEVATKSEFYTKEEVDSLVGKSLAMKAVGNERTRASNKPNYGL